MAWFALATPLAMASGGNVSQTTWVERTAYLMGTTLQVAVAVPSKDVGVWAIESAFAEVSHLETVLSTWREDSELSRINAGKPRTWTAISPELGALLEEARFWSRETGGAFDPGIGSLIDVWDLRGEGRIPADDELARALDASGLDQFGFAEDSVSRLDVESWIDAGAFGKGVALRRVEAALRDRGVTAGLLNFGGQVLAIGASTDSPGWRVVVAHPAQRDRPMMTLVLRDRSAATTSQSEHLGHVLDPHTGRPVPPWGSVTVVARDPLLADVLATALFVMGPEAGMRWVASRRDVGALFLVLDGDRVEPHWNQGLAGFLAPDYIRSKGEPDGDSR